MASIVTITFNPCIDKSSYVDALIPDKKLRCTPFVNEPGGGGINVARALQRLGADPHAIYLAGGYTGIILNKLLQAEKINITAIDTTSDTRENIMITDRSTNLQYRFITPGNAINETHWLKCLEAVEKIEHPDFVIVSGSLQPEIPVNIFEKLSLLTKASNSKLIIDVPTEVLINYKIQNAYLIKPNLNELSMLAGKEELHGDEITIAARNLIKNKVSEVVVVSMGAAGALLVTNEIEEQFMAPPVKRKSTVGAGDSMLAGVIFYLSQKKNIKDAVRFGVACGTAATLNEGTQLCNPADADKLYKLMQQYST